MWDLSSLTIDWMGIPCTASWILNCYSLNEPDALIINQLGKEVQAYFWILNLIPLVYEWVSEGHSVMSDSLRPHGLYSPWNSLGQNTGVVAFPFSWGSSQPRDRTQVSLTAGDSLPAEPQGKPPLVYRSIIMSASHRFGYWSFVVGFEVGKCESSNFVFFQDCFGFSGPLSLPYNFYNWCFCFGKIGP